MPNIDISLNDLKNYKGVSPKPNDFKEFWANSLKELNETEINLEIKKFNFDNPICDCYTLSFDGIDGERISGKMLLPKNINKKLPTLVEFHGYGSNSGNWTKRFHFVASGFAYFTMDCRNQMGNSGSSYYRRGNLVQGLETGPKDLYFRKVFLDATRFLTIIDSLDEVDSNSISTLGYSQGGALALVSSVLFPKVSKVFSIYPYLSDFKRVWNLDLGESAYEELRDFFRWYDPLHEKENSIFETLGYIDVQNFAKDITCPVTMVTGLMDKVCPPSTQFSVFNKISSPKEHIIYHDFAHENINGLEDIIYKWILNL